MPDPHTPFPQPGCYALLADGDDLHLVSISYRLNDALAVVDLPLVEGVASGTRRVALADLRCADALPAADLRDLADLQDRDALFNRGQGRALSRKDRTRLDALAAQQGNHNLRAGLLDQLARRRAAHRRMVAA